MSSALVLVAAALGASHGGYKLEQVLVVRTPQADGTTKEQREGFVVCLAGRRARLRRENGEDVIVRLDRREIIELDRLLENYKRKGFDELRAMWRTRNALYLDQIEGAPLNHPNRAALIDRLDDGPEKWEQIWKLPPGDDRARLQARYHLPENPPTIEIRETDQTMMIAGIETHRYEALEDGVASGWAYLAPGLPFDQRYFEFLELRQWIPPELARRLMHRSMRRAGMPLETHMRARSGVEVKVLTKAVKKSDFDPSVFDVPAGYLEQKAAPAFR